MPHIGNWLQHLIRAVRAGDRDAIQGMSVAGHPATAAHVADAVSGISMWTKDGTLEPRPCCENSVNLARTRHENKRLSETQ